MNKYVVIDEIKSHPEGDQIVVTFGLMSFGGSMDGPMTKGQIAFKETEDFVISVENSEEVSMSMPMKYFKGLSKMLVDAVNSYRYTAILYTMMDRGASEAIFNFVRNT